MPTYNYNIKIVTGEKTDMEIVVNSTLVNNKKMLFKGSKLQISTYEMEIWITDTVEKALKEYVNKYK